MLYSILLLLLHMCVCVYLYTYYYSYTCVYIYIYIHIRTHVYIQMYIHMCVCIYIYIYICYTRDVQRSPDSRGATSAIMRGTAQKSASNNLSPHATRRHRPGTSGEIHILLTGGQRRAIAFHTPFHTPSCSVPCSIPSDRVWNSHGVSVPPP